MKLHVVLHTGLAATLLTATLLTTSVALLPGSAVRAEEGEEHGAGEALVVPGTLTGIWSMVREKQTALGEIIQAKELDKVHVTAFQIRDLVSAMPGKSQSLSADSQKRLAESVTRVADIARLLDEYGDGGDQAKTQEQAMRLGKLLTYVESLYPAGALGAGHAEAGPHGGAVVASGDYRLELVAAKGELSLFVLDTAGQPVPIDKMTAMAMAGAKAETHVPLPAAGDHFAGKLAVPNGGSIPVNVTVNSATGKFEGRFVVSEKGAMAREPAGVGHKAGPAGTHGSGK